MTKRITIGGKSYPRASRIKSGRKDIKKHALKLRKEDKQLGKDALKIYKTRSSRGK
jgi:hypothetical protein